MFEHFFIFFVLICCTFSIVLYHIGDKMQGPCIPGKHFITELCSQLDALKHCVKVVMHEILIIPLAIINQIFICLSTVEIAVIPNEES